MKVAFFFDTVLLKNKNNNFYGMTLTYEFFKNRYLQNFQQMIISTRVKNMDEEKGDVSGYRQTDGENVEVKPINSYKAIPDAIINRKHIEKEIGEILQNVDKVIIRMPSVIGMFACKCAEKYKKPYLIEMVACPWDGYSNHTHWEGKILAPIMWHLNRKYIKKAPKVLYVTDKYLQKRYPTKGEQIACSDVVLNEFDDDVLQERLKKIKNMDMKSTIKLATIASVELKYKGQEFVMKAMSRLNKEGKKFEYYLAGAGDNTRLKNIARKYKIEEQVHFLGSLPHNEVFRLIDDIDIYIQPSLQEGLPRALIEAMSRACPAIGSTTGGIPELLEPKYIFKKKKYKKLVRILNQIKKEDLEEQAKKNYNMSKKFDDKILYSKRQKFYKSL